MPLDMPDGSACFVDSNVLYYALVQTAGTSDRCIALLNRAISGSVRLFVTVPVLSDVLHKVMASEAAQLTGRDRAGIVSYLGKHPEIISKLTQYPQTTERLSAVPMTILPVDEKLLARCAQVAVARQLLTSDSMIVAVMERHGLESLATNDDDFDQVPGLKIWKPR